MDKDENTFVEQLDRVRPVTRNLIESILLDAWPGNAAVVDFGIDSQKHYEALYYPVREGEISPTVLDAALGHGQKLTAMTLEAVSNPHKDVEFYTSWDLIFGRDRYGMEARGDLEDSAEPFKGIKADPAEIFTSGPQRPEKAPEAIEGKVNDKGIER